MSTGPLLLPQLSRSSSSYTPLAQEPPETEVPHEQISVATDYEEEEEEEAHPRWACYERWESGAYTISPNNNCWVDIWDVFVILALIATAIVVPFEVALIAVPSPGLYLLNKIIDGIFVTDIILNFNMQYSVMYSDSTERYEREPRKIAKHYMAMPCSNDLDAGWFWMDAGTVFPWEIVTRNREMVSFRVVRCLRLIRMLRLVRVVKLFRRWHTQFGFSFALVKLTRCMSVTLLITHWLACLWAHLGLHGDEYSAVDVDHDTWLSMTHLAKSRDVHEFSCWEAYQLSLYFSAVVLTTVGFGDVAPMNKIEVLTMTATIFLTAMTWTWVVGNIVDILANIDLYTVHFNRCMDDLNVLMAANGVSHDLKRHIRKYLHGAHHVHRQRHHKHVIQWLSGGLQGELAVESGVPDTLGRIWYFQSMKDEWLIDLAQVFKAEMFSPCEYIATKFVCSVIRKGTCVQKGRILVKGAVVGEDMILLCDYLKESSWPRTLCMVEVMSLTRDDLVEVCEIHEQLNQRIRKAQIKLGLWRAFILLANRISAERKKRQKDWDGFFKVSMMEVDNQAKQDFWIMASQARLPGWTAFGTACRHTTKVVHIPDGPPLPSPTSQQPDDTAEMLVGVCGVRKCFDDLRGSQIEQMETLSSRLDVLEQRMPPASTPTGSMGSGQSPGRKTVPAARGFMSRGISPPDRESTSPRRKQVSGCFMSRASY